MAAQLPADFDDLLRAPLTAVLVTLMPDGMPQASPVWYWYDGTFIKISTVRDRQKYRNVLADPRSAFTVVDPAKPLRYVEVRGHLHVEDDPQAEIRRLIGYKHGFADGGDSFDGPGTQRVVFVMTPVRVIASPF